MITADEKKIVIARLQTMSPRMSLSIGNAGSLSKWDLIKHVEQEDQVGKLIVGVYMNGLRAFKERVENAQINYVGDVNAKI